MRSYATCSPVLFVRDIICAALLLSAGVCAAEAAPDAPDPAAAFRACTEDLRATARAAGLPDLAINAVLDSAEQLPRAIAADRAQPEFTETFTEYYAKRVTATRIERGRRLFNQHRQLLTRVELKSGVPAQYLLAFWGLETNFGSYMGKLSIPSALATLACDARRSDFFTTQLLAVIEGVGDGDLEVDTLVGSWAGAMGHMQFMPTTFLKYAVDGDRDGRRDLYNSLEDALYSAANFLRGLGWAPGFRWGREVRLPDGFDYALAGSDQWRTLSFWHEQGLTDVFGNALPALTIEAAVLLPAGHRGPAFVVYDNFRTIMQWNRSESYALSVGRLADRIAGAGRLAEALPAKEDIAIPRAGLLRLQETLADRGYDPGAADGVLGPATRGAIRRFQLEAGLIPDGYPNAEVFAAIDAEANRVAPPDQAL